MTSPYAPKYVDPKNNPRHSRKGPPKEVADEEAPKAKKKAPKKKAT